MCVHPCSFVCTPPVQLYTQKPEVYTSAALHLFFETRVAHRTWSSLTQLDWLANEPQGSACLLPSSRATEAHYCAWLPRWVLGIWTQGLWLVQQALYGLSHLPKPKQQFFQNQTEMRSKPFSVVLHGFINDVRNKTVQIWLSQIIFLAECNLMGIKPRVSQVHLNLNIL